MENQVPEIIEIQNASSGLDNIVFETVKCESTTQTRRKGRGRQVKEVIYQDNNVSLLCSLLYAHTYFLNTIWSKTISIGYCPDTFQLRIILNDCFGERRILLSTFEWSGLVFAFQKVMKLVDSAQKELNDVSSGIKTGINSYTKQRIRVTPSFSILVEQNLKEVAVVFQHNQNGVHSAISFNYEEWIRLYSNMDFFNTILEELKHSTIIVIAYFEQYVLRSVEHPLETAEFFVLSGFSPSDIAKFSRLFYEIAVLCKKNVQKLVQLEKQARGIIK